MRYLVVILISLSSKSNLYYCIFLFLLFYLRFNFDRIYRQIDQIMKILQIKFCEDNEKILKDVQIWTVRIYLRRNFLFVSVNAFNDNGSIFNHNKKTFNKFDNRIEENK